MGCCLSTAAAADDSKPPHPPPPPPPLLFEEESVKEVLSETPVVNPNSTTNKLSGDNQRRRLLLPPEEEKEEFRSPRKESTIEEKENASEVSSEMYTCSMTFSGATTTTTTTIGNGIDEDGEVTQKVNKPSPAKLVRRRQQSTVSAGRRKQQSMVRQRLTSPAKGSVVPSKKPQVPSRNVNTAGHHRNVVPSNVVQREPLARRSRSPAMRGELGYVRKVERSPVRQSTNRVPVTVTEKEGNDKLKKPNDGGVVPVPEPESEPETGESLENPLVSLECFIFL